jgi:probable phosphoglycerate mutase
MSAAAGGPLRPPAGVRTVPPPHASATVVVLVRHGEAVCNVEGVVGGVTGCRGLTGAGRAQVAALADRLERTGELAGVAALYASVLPRAVETAELLAPALDRWRDGPALAVTTDCDLCELHPGEADGLDWGQFAERYSPPDWDADPTAPLAPGGESWAGFVARAAAAVERLADRHRGQVVVAACHAGVVESTMLRFLPLDPATARLGLRTEHASLTVWERAEGRWTLRRYNDAARA